MRTLVLLGLVASCADVSSSENNAVDSYAGAELTADVAPAEGKETVHATVAEVTIRDATGAVIASLPGYDAEGSRDEVLGIRVSEGYIGSPLIGVTTTVGGRRESTTYLALYRVQGAQLERLFDAPIEVTADASVATGSVLVFPGTVLYRAPRAERPALYSFDAAAHRYVIR